MHHERGNEGSVTEDNSVIRATEATWSAWARTTRSKMAKHVKLDLHERANPGCQKCPRPDRLENTELGLCDVTVSILDGAPVRCVGQWAQRKIHFLTQYFGIFASGMKKKWDGHIHYIELCSGPGRCIDRDSGTEMDGSPLAVLSHKAFPYLETATFLDFNPIVVQSLNERITKLGNSAKASAMAADYNDAAGLVATLSPRAARGLSLVFIDPTDCSLPFETVAAIAKALHGADFIINVATRTDATRNLKQAILNIDSRARTKYCSFLGSDAFFQDARVIRAAQVGQDTDLRIWFREAYRDAFRRIGYNQFELESVQNYYDLLFASRHKTGLEFWKKAQQITPDDQRKLDFGI